MNKKFIRKVLEDLKENFDKTERKEILTKMLEKETDFEVNDYRFIAKNEIDNIMQDELSSDTYILGCFSAWFIADITGLSLDIVEKAQKNENFDLLRELMKQKIEEVVEKYISSDGYGQHFGHYDGNEYETENYYYFKIN